MASPLESRHTAEQLARYRRVFNLLDVNKNGVIDAKEMAAMAKVMGYQMDRGQIQKMLGQFDADRNTVLTFDEFVNIMPSSRGVMSRAEQRKAEFRAKFAEFDRDGNGYIETAEAAGMLAKEIGFSKTKTRQMLETFDKNYDGKLSYDEFLGFYYKVKEKKEGVDAAFRQFDREGKGYVTVEDAIRILATFGFSDAEVMALVNAHDTNQDGMLQYDEFVHFWTI